MSSGQEDPRWNERKTQRPYRKQRKTRLFKRTREQLEQTDEQRLLRIILDLCRVRIQPFHVLFSHRKDATIWIKESSPLFEHSKISWMMKK